MMVRRETKDAVLCEIASVIRAASAEGKDGLKVAEAKFPGTPYMVLIEASVIVEMEDEDDWWEKVETTIDGEIMRQSLRIVGEGA